jgi:photosystem II stability/assembly factor-like uncharacterized protein
MKNYLLFIPALLLSGAINAQSWTGQATGFTTAGRGVVDVCAVDANVVWIAAYDGSVASAPPIQEFSKTTDGGTTWTPGTISAPTNYALTGICAIDASTAWTIFFDNTAGTGGGIFKTTDGGTTWTQQGVGTIFDANSFPDIVYFANSTLGFAVGDPNGGYFEIYTTTDGGTTWTRTPQANIPAPSAADEYGYTNLYDVIGTTIWFGTNKGRVFKSTDGGLNWTVSTTGLGDMNDLVMIDANNGLAVFGTAMMKTTDGGATWTAVNPVGPFHASDIESVPGTSVYVSTGAATGDFGSSYSMDAGATWIKIDSGATAAEQHTAQGWINSSTGWCGGFSTSATADGIFKYAGAGLGVPALNRDNARLRVYPNPSNGQFTVQIGGAETEDAVVSIVDLVGSTVYQNTIHNSSTVIEKGYDLRNISKGVYFVNIVNGKTQFTQKLIIK